MSVETWEEACQYTWRHKSGDTEIFTEIEGDALYYYLVGDVCTDRRMWLTINRVPLRTLTEAWYITGDSPIAKPLLTPQEKVCKKIALMEKRWLDFQFRKSEQQRKQHA